MLAYVLDNKKKTIYLTKPVQGTNNLLKNSCFETISFFEKHHPFILFLKVLLFRIVRRKTI